MDRIAVFIDGGYLDYVVSNELGGLRFDYGDLVRWMCGNVELLRAHYYHCLPWQSARPTKEESARLSRRQKLFTALKALPHFEVRLGRLEYRGKNQDGQPIFKQKQVDILMGIDLVLLASKQRISHAALFTGDSDFLPAIEVAKREGVIINLFHGGKPHAELVAQADAHWELTRGVADSWPSVQAAATQ